MDVSGLLAFDHRRVVVGDAQRDLHAQFLREVLDQRRVAVGDAGGVLGRHEREYDFGILRFPVLRECTAGGEGEQARTDDKASTIEHDAVSPVNGLLWRTLEVTLSDANYATAAS